MATALRENWISQFPVLDDDGKVPGLGSEAELLTKRALESGYDSLPGMITGPVEVAARLMYTLQVKRLPVTDPNGRLAGIISRADVLAIFDRSDEEIRKEVADDVICQEFGAAPRQFAVTVQAGVVTLEGNAETAALGHIIVRKVRHVQGVVAVRDRLSYPDANASIAGPGF